MRKIRQIYSPTYIPDRRGLAAPGLSKRYPQTNRIFGNCSSFTVEPTRTFEPSARPLGPQDSLRRPYVRLATLWRFYE